MMRNITISRFVVLLDVRDNRRGACHLGGSNLLLRRFACDKLRDCYKNTSFTCEINDKNKVENFADFSLAIVGSLRTSSEIFASFRESSVVFGNLLKYSEIVGEWPKSLWYTKQNNTGLFGAVFASVWIKIYCYGEFCYC